jgi:hypothetical protein
MKKQYLAVVFTLICVLGLGLGASAQQDGTIVVTVPFDFLVSGNVLPAGTYTVGRVDFPAGPRELVISSFETRASAVLVPSLFDGAQTGHAQLNFEHIGNKYFLSAVETPIGAYAIAVPPSATKLAQTEQQDLFPSGGN